MLKKYIIETLKSRNSEAATAAEKSWKTVVNYGLQLYNSVKISFTDFP